MCVLQFDAVIIKTFLYLWMTNNSRSSVSKDDTNTHEFSKSHLLLDLKCAAHANTIQFYPPLPVLAKLICQPNDTFYNTWTP